MDLLYNKTNPQQLDIHLTHSRRRLAIESRANYVIILRYTSFI